MQLPQQEPFTIVSELMEGGVDRRAEEPPRQGGQPSLKELLLSNKGLTETLTPARGGAALGEDASDDGKDESSMATAADLASGPVRTSSEC